MGLKKWVKKNKWAAIGSVLGPLGTAAGVAVDASRKSKEASKKATEKGAEAYDQGIDQIRQQLSSEEKEYEGIPTRLRTEYIKQAQRAGTYSGTPEFESGLGSEVQAGSRGARLDAVGRINALRRRLGITEEFKDESAGPTAGAVTKAQLATGAAAAPVMAKESEGAVALPADVSSQTSSPITTPETPAQKAARLAAMARAGV